MIIEKGYKISMEKGVAMLGGVMEARRWGIGTRLERRNFRVGECCLWVQTSAKDTWVV